MKISLIRDSNARQLLENAIEIREPIRASHVCCVRSIELSVFLGHSKNVDDGKIEKQKPQQKTEVAKIFLAYVSHMFLFNILR